MPGETKSDASRSDASKRPIDTEADARLERRTYAELRSLAEAYLRRERSGHTLQPTALVHEAWLRIAGETGLHRGDRNLFVSHAAQAMRRVLVEHARRRDAHKRGANAARITLSADLVVERGPDLDLLALDDALERLAALDPRQARVVELRFFGGLTVEDAAAALGLSKRAVEADWTLARAWLRQQLLGDS